MTETYKIKIKAGKYKHPVELIPRNDRIFMKFPYNPKLIEAVKTLEGYKWHGFEDPPIKMWSFIPSERNDFRLAFLQGLKPYAPWDTELLDYVSNRPLRDHQIEMVRHAITRHYGIFACEMGTGKSLAAIEVMEYAMQGESRDSYDLCWYIGPKSGVRAYERELRKWESTVRPRIMTYEALRKVVSEWDSNQKAPKVVIFDESSKIKTPTAKRSKAAMHLASSVREDWGSSGFAIEMSGTPAPKSPVDWWHQCEIACPGFLTEGNIHQLKHRLCIVEQRESITGGMYPHIVTWLDDETKCSICGKYQDDSIHGVDGDHGFSESINEVGNLYGRMKGLVLVKFKKDCLNLPEKQYEIIDITPSPELLRAAKLITRTSSRGVEALTLIRELSDGFQYKDKPIGEKPCEGCNGEGEYDILVDPNQDDMAPQEIDPSKYEKQRIICPNCGGKGTTVITERSVEEIGSAKDEVLVEMLDEHEDVGRLVVWGGFQGTVDRIVRICHQQGWATLKIDGRGYEATTATGDLEDEEDFLDAMDKSHPQFKAMLEKFPKLCLVGNPDAGGMALTFTASPTAFYYSNSFKADARSQSEDRIHRDGMDENISPRIIDCVLLNTDELVLKNLKQKKDLQNLTMGEINEALENVPKTVSR